MLVQIMNAESVRKYHSDFIIGILRNFKKKIPKSMVHPRPSKLKFKGFDLNISSFLKVAEWLECVARVEYHC